MKNKLPKDKKGKEKPEMWIHSAPGAMRKTVGLSYKAKPRRIGILSGLFDPTHKGHIALATEAIKRAELDDLYFLVETQPWRKTHVTHFAHRLAMLRLAIKSDRKLHVLDLPDKKFSVVKTLPRLKQRFQDDDLFFIAGSDMLEHMPTWPLISRMLESMGMIVALRGNDDSSKVNQLAHQLPAKVKSLTIINSPLPNLSSGKIRQALLSGKPATGLEPAVLDYIKANWLYASPSNSSSAL